MNTSALITDKPDIALNDFLMARSMAEALHAAYPGHLWAVDCSGQTGMAHVRNLALSGNMGFSLHLRAIYSASEFKREVLRAGGEILERYRLARGRMDFAKFNTMPTDFAGRLIADTSK